MPTSYELKFRSSNVPDLALVRLYYEYYTPNMPENEKAQNPVNKSSDSVDVPGANWVQVDPNVADVFTIDLLSLGVFVNELGTYLIGVAEVDSAGNESLITLVSNGEVRIDATPPPGATEVEIIIS